MLFIGILLNLCLTRNPALKNKRFISTIKLMIKIILTFYPELFIKIKF